MLAQACLFSRVIFPASISRMPEVMIGGKVYNIDPRDYVTEPKLERGLFTRFQAADGRIPKVRDQKLTGPVTVSVRECVSYHVRGVPHPRFVKPFHILELDIQALMTLMPSSMLDTDSERYYPGLLSVIWTSERRELGWELCEGLMRGFAHGLEPSQQRAFLGLFHCTRHSLQVSKNFF